MTSKNKWAPLLSLLLDTCNKKVISHLDGDLSICIITHACRLTCLVLNTIFGRIYNVTPSIECADINPQGFYPACNRRCSTTQQSSGTVSDLKRTSDSGCLSLPNMSTPNLKMTVLQFRTMQGSHQNESTANTFNVTVKLWHLWWKQSF